MRTLTIDCVTCPVRDVRCGDCVVTLWSALEASGPGPVADLDRDERAAVALLAGAGLVTSASAAAARAELAHRGMRRSAG